MFTEMAMAQQLLAEKKRCKYLIVGKSNGVENLLLKNFQGTCWCLISIESTVFYLIAISNLTLQQKTKTYLMEKKDFQAKSEWNSFEIWVNTKTNRWINYVRIYSDIHEINIERSQFVCVYDIKTIHWMSVTKMRLAFGNKIIHLTVSSGIMCTWELQWFFSFNFTQRIKLYWLDSQLKAT